MRDMIWILSTFSFLCATAAAYSMLRTTSLSTSRLIHALIFLLAARLCPRHGSIVGDMPLLTKCCTLPTPLSSGSTQLGVVWLILLLTSQSVPFSGQLGVGDISRFITLSDRSVCFFFMVLLDDTFLRTVIKELLLLGCSSFSSSSLSLALLYRCRYHHPRKNGRVVLFFSAKMKTLSSSAWGACRGPPSCHPVASLMDGFYFLCQRAWQVLIIDIFPDVDGNWIKQVLSVV